MDDTYKTHMMEYITNAFQADDELIEMIFAFIRNYTKNTAPDGNPGAARQMVDHQNPNSVYHQSAEKARG